MARLILNWEGVDLVTHELIDDTVMVGRAPSNNIIIEHLTVSAEHAVLLRVADSYFLKDLNSTNGTQLNGVLVTEADLKDGDTIRFGSVIAVFAGCSRKRSSTCAIRRSGPVPRGGQNAARHREGMPRKKWNWMIQRHNNSGRLTPSPRTVESSTA